MGHAQEGFQKNERCNKNYNKPKIHGQENGSIAVFSYKERAPRVKIIELQYTSMGMSILVKHNTEFKKASHKD